MSIPSGKPFGSPDPSIHAQRDGERLRDDGEQARSPYAPKRVRGGFVADPVRRADDEVAAPPRFLLSSREDPGKERGLTDFPKSSLQFEDELNAAGIGRPAATERRRAPGDPGQPPTARHPDGVRHASVPAQMIDDAELKRLEESVRLLQREVSPGRGRAPDGPPAAPVVTPDDAGAHRRRGDDAYINGFRVPRSLQPETLRRPPQGGAGRGRLQTALAVLVAGVVAAPIAYYFSTGSNDPRPAPETVVAAAEPRAVETSSIAVRTQRIDPVAAHNSDAWPKSVPGPPVTPPQESASPPAPPPVTSVPKRATPPAGETAETPRGDQAPPVAPTRTLGQAEIDLLVKQGQQFVAAGDFVTARLVFQRAAEAGNAVAALALGASYDPGVLSSLGVRGVDADVTKAMAWYQKAKEFGEPEATRRLDVLANRGGR